MGPDQRKRLLGASSAAGSSEWRAAFRHSHARCGGAESGCFICRAGPEVDSSEQGCPEAAAGGRKEGPDPAQEASGSTECVAGLAASLSPGFQLTHRTKLSDPHCSTAVPVEGTKKARLSDEGLPQQQAARTPPPPRMGPLPLAPVPPAPLSSLPGVAPLRPSSLKATRAHRSLGGLAERDCEIHAVGARCGPCEPRLSFCSSTGAPLTPRTAGLVQAWTQLP
jgi:hypothetical protein